jgi:hypothetical protein
MLFYVDREGKARFEKNNFTRERLDIIDNPLFEDILRHPESLTADQLRRANLLVAYQ